MTEAEEPPWGQAEAGVCHGPMGQDQQSPCLGKSDLRAAPGSRLTVELGEAVAAAQGPVRPYPTAAGAAREGSSGTCLKGEAFSLALCRAGPHLSNQPDCSVARPFF